MKKKLSVGMKVLILEYDQYLGYWPYAEGEIVAITEDYFKLKHLEHESWYPIESHTWKVQEVICWKE